MAGPRGNSDVEALSRSFRSRVLLLGLLVVGGIAAATWERSRDQGRGAAEHPRRVMVVTAGEGIDYFPLFTRAGFEVEIDSFGDWEAGAREALPESDHAEAGGVPLLLELADERGVAFVVFEQPAKLDFEGLELEPSLDAIEELERRDYMVLSVGDLSFPHRASVDSIDDETVLRVPGYGALEALFGQPRLAADREELDRPTVIELQLEDSIRRGRVMVERPRGFSRTIDGLVSDSLATLAEDRAELLSEPLQTGTALPTPDGGLLLLRHDLQVYSDDAETLELDVDPDTLMTFDWLSPEAIAEGRFDASVRCTELAGGEIALAEEPSFESASDGSTIAISTARDGVRLWRSRSEPGSAAGCRWTELSELPSLEPSEFGFGELAPRLVSGDDLLLARVGESGSEATLRVWTDGDGGTVEELLSLPDVQFGDLAFLDGQRVALLSRTMLPDDADELARAHVQHALHVVDRRRPGAHLRIPADFIAPGRSLREVLAMPTKPSSWQLHVLLTAPDRTGSVAVIELRLTAEAAAELDEQLASAGLEVGEADEGPILLTLTPEQVVVREVFEHDDLRGWALAPRGDALALVVGDPQSIDTEVARLDLASARLDLLTDNPVRDYLPRFTADGQGIVFASVMRLPISELGFSVPRLARVDAPR